MDYEDIEVISELIEGENLFDSRGYSVVKITKIEKQDTGKDLAVVHAIKLPIKSTGVAEYQEQLKSKTPVPPITKEFVKKNSPEGKELGLPHDRMVQVFDLTDIKYVDDLEKFNQELNWRVAIYALDMVLKKADGSIAETYEEKKQVLKTSGITLFHINKILRDVNDLTLWAEDRQDFLSGGL